MTTYGIIFPGQGSQKVGMDKDIISSISHAQSYFDTAKEILGIDLLKLCQEGPINVLTQTKHAQPAIFLISAILYTELKKHNIHPTLVAGHSLGELTAYWASNVLSLEETLKLIKTRGQAMADSYPSEDSAMSAVIGMEAEELETILAPLKDEPVVLANYNCPGQVVISGTKQGIEKAEVILKEKKARIVPLSVSGPFHSPLMQDASESLQKYIQTISFNEATAPIILNRTAKPEAKKEMLQKNVAEQVKSSVHWSSSMTYMEEKVDVIIECGPGRILSNLAKKINSDIPVVTISDFESIEAFTSQISVTS